MRHHKWALWLLAIVALCCVDSMTRCAHASLTLEDERKLGKEFYDRLEKSHLISQNERANAFLSKIGDRVLAKSDKVPFDFRFTIIRSSAINAFATPGGYVYVNQGLINLVENEGQLAGVL